MNQSIPTLEVDKIPQKAFVKYSGETIESIDAIMKLEAIQVAYRRL
jgi:hypothetical protein